MTTPAVVLTPRDIEIIIMVYLYDGLLISHLQRKFWPNVLSHTSYYRRIRQLIQAGYLKVNNQTPLIRSERMFLTVGPSSRPLLSEWLGVSPSQLERPTQTTSPFIIAHRSAVADVRLSLELAADAYPWIRSLDWQSEGELARTPMQVKEQGKAKGELRDQTRTILPDGAFSLISNTHSFRSFVEVDMGTIPHRLSEKLKDYLTFERDNSLKVPVLFVVSDNFRLQVDRSATIMKWAVEEATKLHLSPGIFWVAKRADISEHSILTSPIWQVAGAGKELKRLPIPYAPIKEQDEGFFREHQSV